MITLDPRVELRLQYGAEHLHSLGARAVAEFLTEIGSDRGDLLQIINMLSEYRRRLSPEMLRLAGGDRFPARVLLVVPR
jgi:hypothetical protein